MKKIVLFSLLSFGLAACLWHTSTEQKNGATECVL